MLELHTVFAIILIPLKNPIRYQHTQPPGEKCGLVLAVIGVFCIGMHARTHAGMIVLALVSHRHHQRNNGHHDHGRADDLPGQGGLGETP